MSVHSFSRTELLIGAEALKRLAKTRVCVIGLGGVGSYAVESLVRAGVGHFTIIDFDVVGETNLNRQILALICSIGKAKTELMKERILAINPSAEVITYQSFIDAENRAELLKDFDYYIDAIDSLGPKIGMLEHAVREGFNIISVMGAGNRLDPSKIHLAPLSKSINCPLARRVRKFLRRRGITGDFPCVYSSELPILPEEDIDSPDEIIIERGRQRKTIGSISYMPAIMGMTAASWVIRSIIEDIT
ncbi:MAG: tRNA threonylcarbamoyladenosine dehydratase [Candidatus Cloacimonadaceae bacterium]|nr:tRNA threonylcarbamoyladenosine dehydratase [Candidatus Cloacimonadaceae bacterium]MDP3113821.1 tRNA threonylcarbamoyladenosine dehydratase [Candidatus Cloacimonadaceae bacterium]